MLDKKTFAVCFGGVSGEHEVSCVSAAWVVENIDTEKFKVVKIGITKQGVWFLYNGDTGKMRDGSWCEDKENLVPCVISPCTVQHGIFTFDKAAGTFKTLRIDAVFPVMHGKNGEDGTIQGLFTLAGIPFVGADTYSSAVCMNKHAAKLIAASAGVTVADWVCIKKKQPDMAALEAFAGRRGYPLFVKPACSGSSVGVSKVRDKEQLFAAVEKAFEYDNTVLVEEAVVGREIEAAVLETADGVLVSRCGEIDPKAEFYDYNAKYISGTAVHYIPADLPERVEEEVRSAARELFSLLDCSGLARVDFFVKEDGAVVFNEINTVPGMTSISLYPLLMENLGIDGKTLTEKLYESAVNG